MGNLENYRAYTELDDEIRSTLKRSASDVVLLGYLLRQMQNRRLWARYYSSFDEYLRSGLHMDYTQASRFIGINRKYSVGGDSKEIDAKYRRYSQSVLVEMLSMPPDLEAEVTPDMTARQVRELKRKKKEEQAKKTTKIPDAAESGLELVNDIPQKLPEADSMDAGLLKEEGQKVFPEKSEVLDAEYRELEPAGGCGVAMSGTYKAG